MALAMLACWCGRGLRIKQNGVLVIERFENMAPYKLFLGDEYQCPECECTVTYVRPGTEPLAEHFQSGFLSTLAQYPPDLRRDNRCRPKPTGPFRWQFMSEVLNTIVIPWSSGEEQGEAALSEDDLAAVLEVFTKLVALKLEALRPYARGAIGAPPPAPPYAAAAAEAVGDSDESGIF